MARKVRTHKGFDDAEKGKDDPVDEPLGVVALAFGFDRLKRLEGGITKANHGSQAAETDKENQEDRGDDHAAQHQVFFGDFGCFLCVVGE